MAVKSLIPNRCRFLLKHLRDRTDLQ